MDLGNDYVLQRSVLALGLIELRKFYTNTQGDRKPGVPGFYFWRADWELFKQARWQLTSAAASRHFLRVLLTGKKVVDSRNGGLILRKDDTSDRRTMVLLTPAMWDGIFTQEAAIDELFATALTAP